MDCPSDLEDESHSTGFSVKHIAGLDDHADNCKRLRRSAYKMPWERGILANDHLQVVKPWIAKGAFPITECQVQDDTPQVLPSTIDVQTFAESSSPKKLTKFHKISHGMTWSDHLDASRALALKKWLSILGSGYNQFGIVQEHYSTVSSACPLLMDSLELAVTMKSTSTLHSRAGPVLRYMKYCKDSHIAAFPLDTTKIFGFLDNIKSDCAPTFPRSLLGSIAFMKFVLNLKNCDNVLNSPLISGLASSLFLKKRKTVQRPPFKVWQVERLEKIATGKIQSNIVDQVAAGFFCYLIFARARFSDGQNSGNLVLDVVKGTNPVEGFIEAAISRSKTSYSLERKTKYLPMVAQVTGLTDVSWALCWVKAMKKAGLAYEKDKPLLPAPISSGVWDSLPISAEAATKWIHRLLISKDMQQGDIDDILKLGTHSCKTTLLSWAAKKGTDLEMRKIMGYHSLGKSNSAFVYGRDNISPALREISTIVKMVKERTFLPDKTRSGYFNTSHEESNTDNVEPSLDDLRGDSSSEDSADDDQANHDEAEESVKAIVGNWVGDYDPDILPQDPSRYVQHSVSRIFHLLCDESGSSLFCGRSTSKSYNSMKELPSVLHPVCKQCFSIAYCGNP